MADELPIQTLRVLLATAITLSVAHGQSIPERQAEVDFVYPEAEEAPLTSVLAAVPDDDGNLFVLDQGHKSVLVFGPDGSLIQTIGREGEGPGEFRRPWQVGLIGDTLWVIDAVGDRVSLFHKRGGHVADFAPERELQMTSADMVDVQALALLSSREVVFVGRSPSSSEETALVRYARDAQSVDTLYTLRNADRVIRVELPVPTGGALTLRNRWDFGDMVAASPYGEHIFIVQRTVPESETSGEYKVRCLTVRENVEAEETRVAYNPVVLDGSVVSTRISGSDMVERLTEFGIYPSSEAASNAILEAMDPPEFHPPVVNDGPGILEYGLVVDHAGSLLVQLADSEDASMDRWDVLSCSRGRRVILQAPADTRILAAAGDALWGVQLSELDVPRIVRLRIADP